MNTLLGHKHTQRLEHFGFAARFSELVASIDFVQSLLHKYLNTVTDHLRDCALEQCRYDINHDVTDPVRQQVTPQSHVNASDRLHLKVLHENVEVVHVDEEVTVDHNVVRSSVHIAIENAQTHDGGNIVVEELKASTDGYM